MKVLFIMRGAYPFFNAEAGPALGGAEANLVSLAKDLSGKEDIDVSFAVGDYGQRDIEIYGKIKVLRIRHMNTVRYGTVFGKVKRYMNLFRFLSKNNSDIFITSTASEILGWITLICGRLRKRKVVFRVASDMDVRNKYPFGKFGILYNFGLSRADAVICQTKQQQDMLKKATGHVSVLIRSGLRMETSGCVSENRRDILWISRFAPMKRPELFIRLASIIPDRYFVMVMPFQQNKDIGLAASGESTLYQDLVKSAKALENMTFVEYVPINAISGYFNKAMLFVCTSSYEGFPNTFLQAFSTGVPVLSFCADPDNVLKENGAGFVCGDSIEAAAALIMGLTPEKAQDMGDKGRKYFMANHDPDTIVTQYERLLKSICGYER